MTTRRRFCLGLASAVGGASWIAPVLGAVQDAIQSGDAEDEPREPAFKISLAQWSLHRAIWGGEIDPLDFAKTAAATYGIDAVEYVNSFFAEHGADFEYLADMRQRAADNGVTSLLIMIDGEGSLGDPDRAARRQAVLRHVRWIAAAGFLGCHSIRVNAAGSGDRDEHSKNAAESLNELGGIADDYGLSVIVENHGGPSSDGAWLAQTIRRADHSAVGTLPDFGNFNVSKSEAYDRYKGVEELMPFARAVSAKSYDFDAEGNETSIDFRRMLELVLAAGYRGHVGIEFEGERLSEHEGILATKRLLERLAIELAG